MIAQDSAFKNFKIQDQVVTGKISATSPYLDGHFPGMPVFPAVGIVDASFYFVKSISQENDLRLAGIPVAKFLSPISPEQNLRIELTSIAWGDWQIDWKDEASSKILATLRIRTDQDS